MHIIYTGPLNVDWIDWEPDIKQRIVEIVSKSTTMTFLYMYRDLLITKEKMKEISTGNGYRQKDHETPTGGDTYENSIADDLELFYQDIKLGRNPLSLAWTYFLPELTLKEMDLIEKKDPEYMRTFKLLNNADVSETEMQLSSSSAKYVIAYCRRRTIAIPSQNLPVAIRESDSAVTNSGEIEELMDHNIVETIDSQNSPDENQESNLVYTVDNSTGHIILNVTNSGEIVELIDNVIMETRPVTEEETLPVHDHFSVTSETETLPDENQESNSTNEENSTPCIDLNVMNSGEIVELVDHEIIETRSITEESLSSQGDFSDTSETRALLIHERTSQKSVWYKLMLLFMILVIIISVTVGLSIYFKKTREKEAVLILSNFIRGSNRLVPMVIDLGATSTGKFLYYFLAGMILLCMHNSTTRYYCLCVSDDFRCRAKKHRYFP